MNRPAKDPPQGEHVTPDYRATLKQIKKETARLNEYCLRQNRIEAALGSGKKYDSAKPELHRIPAEALIGLADVFAFGAKKYGEDNWRKGIEPKRLYNAALRHMLAWNEGAETDGDSGLPHIAHAMCNMAMMIALKEKQDEP